jgi:hypothetical protein
MALPTIAVASTAVDNLYAVLSHRKERQKNREAVNSLQQMRSAVINAYKADYTVVVTDTTDASPTAAFVATGEVALASAAAGKGATAGVGDIFITTGGTADFTDNALATAKGGAVASADRFVVLSATTVGYLGGATDVSFSDEELADFVSIGS